MAEDGRGAAAEVGRGVNIEPLTIAEAMKLTGRSKRTIDRWIKDGHLHPVDLGGFNGVIVAKGEVWQAEKLMRDHQKESRESAPEAAT